MNNRITWIDAAKGIGILLVVIGHTMSPVMEGYIWMEKAYSILYVFHMPLFFLLSGMVSGKLMAANACDKGRLLIQRCKRLMVPYFVWAVIYAPMKLLLKEQVRFTQKYALWTILFGNNPAGQLWFLYVLFLLSAITIYLVNQKNLHIWCIAGLVISFFAPMIPSTIGFTGIGLSFSLYQVGFFFLGLFLTQQKEIGFAHWKMAAGCIIVWLIYTSCLILGKDTWYWKLPAAVSVLYCLLYCMKNLPQKVALPLSYLGRKSMEIYILHAPILVVGRICLKHFLGQLPWIYVGVMTVGTIGGSFIISKMCKNNVIRFLVFGEEMKK